MTQLSEPTPATYSAAVDGDDFALTVRSKSSIEHVFAALTEPSRLSAWWVEASGSGLEGGELSFLFPVEKLVVRVDEANHATVRWTPLVCEPVPDWVGTTITFRLSRTADGESQIDFRHAGLATLQCFELCRNGWEFYLPSMVAYVDAGRSASNRATSSSRE